MSAGEGCRRWIGRLGYRASAALGLVVVFALVLRHLGSPGRAPVLFATLRDGTQDYAWIREGTVVAARAVGGYPSVELVSTDGATAARRIWTATQADAVSDIQVHAGGAAVTWSAGDFWYAWDSRTGFVARRRKLGTTHLTYDGPDQFTESIEPTFGDWQVYQTRLGAQQPVLLGRAGDLRKVLGRAADGNVVAVGETSSRDVDTCSVVELGGGSQDGPPAVRRMPFSPAAFFRDAVLTPDGARILWLTMDTGTRLTYWLTCLHLASDRPGVDIWMSDTHGGHLRHCASLDSERAGFGYGSHYVEGPEYLRIRPGGRQASYLFNNQVFVVDIQ